jgi:hypothetical protein
VSQAPMPLDVPRTDRRSALHRYGLAPTSAGAVQIDITAVLRRAGDGLVETYLCDHNCTISHRGLPTGGHYNCPAALTKNRGAIASTVAPADLLLEGIERTLVAARTAEAAFAETGFDAYAETFRLPPDVRAELRAALTRGPSEVTLFGGSPEAHPGILELVAGLRERGHRVHVTMTGRKLIRTPGFLDEIVHSGPTVLALSADDVPDVATLQRLLQADPAELRAQWRTIPPMHGQRQKLYEAVHAARLWQALPAPERPGLLFNTAVHQGNVTTIGEVLGLLAEAFPAAALNPFPLQSAFERRVEQFDHGRLRAMREFVGRALAEQHERGAGRPGAWGLVRRMHYWLLLAAVAAERTAPVRLTGWNTWQCFRSAGAGRYVQIAGTGRRPVTPAPAGGRVGCFWTGVLNDDDLPPVWAADPERIRRYLDLRPARAAEAPIGCAGCLFPRLVGDMVSLECGMDPLLRDAYLDLRRQHLSF